MQGQLGDIDDDVTQKLMILLSIQVLLVAFVIIAFSGHAVLKYQWNRRTRMDLEDGGNDNAGGPIRASWQLTCSKLRLGSRLPKTPKAARAWYDTATREFGEGSSAAVAVGINLAHALIEENRWIEGERLVKKIYGMCRRWDVDADGGGNSTGGDDALAAEKEAIHDHVETMYDFFTTRVVRLKSRNDDEQFELLPYEEGDRTCVVVGPIDYGIGDKLAEREMNEEETFTAEFDDLLLMVGTPVVCHGLEGSKIHYLQGKIGTILSCETWVNPMNEEGIRYLLIFEDQNLKPCKLGEKFVRVVFELPEKQGVPQGSKSRKKRK